jgi:flagellar M-ring protein FliF
MQTLIDRAGGLRRIFTIGVGLGAIALIVAVSRWATAPTWVPVLSNIPLETTSEITEKLDQASVAYQLGRGGSDIMVAATDLARARVALARDGIPTGTRPGMELFDKPAYAMTDFTQRINYRRALEGELERTIGKMRGIQSAQVHLAMHETSSFRAASSPSEASVVLKLRTGEEPANDIVQGIAHLVASSVDGLASDRVTVVDDAGRLLSVPNEPDSPLGLSSRQLANQRDIEQHLSDKAEEIVSQMVGRGNSRVQVAAALNFDRVERTTQTLDPDKQVASTEQKAEIVPGAQGGAGSTNQATTYENSKSTEIYAGAVGTIRRLTVAVLVNDKMTGSGDSATFTRRAPEELARIESLVRNAVGFDSARGDLVSVVSVPFAIPAVPTASEDAKPTIIQKVQPYQSLILNVVALVFAFVIGFMALKSVRSMRTTAGAALAAPSQAYQFPSNGMSTPLAASSDSSSTPRMMPEMAAMQANSDTRNRVTATVNEQPEVAARLVRAWMKEA